MHKRSLLGILFFMVLLPAFGRWGRPVPDLVVARDGSGDYQTLGAALAAAPAGAARPFVILIKAGTYQEKLVVPAEKINLFLLGEDRVKTILTYDDHAGKGQINTFTSYTIKVLGHGFRAENLTFVNSAGPVGQAVALHLEADRCAFFNCRIIGNQDTFYGGPGQARHYFRDCYFEGTTDFLFGPSTVVFQRCTIHSKKNSYITAASTPSGQPFGYVFLDCRLTASAEAHKVYLGRPWRPYARTVFIRTHMGGHILPAGWHNWNKPEAEQTAFYAEYQSSGPGGDSSQRVPWSRRLRQAEVKAYTLKKMLGGNDNWNPLKK